MAASPYVYERQVEYWTSREVEGFLLDQGFEVLVFPLTALTEKEVPADFLFLDKGTSKLFGFQFKTLYGNGNDHWVLSDDQHRTMRSYSWLYYGLSEMSEVVQYRSALHYLRLVDSDFEFKPRLERGDLTFANRARYVRWAPFFEGLKSCRYGCRIRTKGQLQRAVWPEESTAAPRELSQFVDEAFVANMDRRRVARFSNLLREEWHPPSSNQPTAPDGLRRR